MKRLCYLILLIIFLASTAWARPPRFVTKYTPSKYKLFLDGSLKAGQVSWKLAFETPPSIVTQYKKWIKWKDYRVAQFEKLAPKERGNTYYFATIAIDGSASDANACTKAAPCASRSKCDSLIAANNGNTRCRFHSGGEWMDSTDWIIEHDNNTVDCYNASEAIEAAQCAASPPLFDAFDNVYFASGWTLAAGNRYTRAETLDIAYVTDLADFYGETRGLPLIRLNSSATVESTSNSFFYDSVGDVLHLNLGGVDPNTLNIATVLSNTNNGIEVQGNGVRVENLSARGFGMHRTAPATQAQPFTIRNTGNERAYFKTLTGFYSGTHVIAHNSAGGGGGMMNGLIAGLGQVDDSSDSNSIFNSYAATGSHETWVVNSEARGGALPEYTWDYAGDKVAAGAAVLAHTNAATQFLIGVTYNLNATVFAGTRMPALADWNDAPVSTTDKFDTFRAFTVKSTLDAYPSAHQDGNSDRNAYVINYGNTWNMRPFASGVIAGFRNDEWNLDEYCFNCRFICDGTNIGNQVYGFYNGTAPTTSVGTIVNSDIIYKNWTVTNGTIRYGSAFDNRTNTGAPDTGNAGNDRIFNTIISVDTSTWPSAGQGSQYAVVGFDNDASEMKNCAISNFKALAANQSAGFDNIANRVDLGAAYNTPGTDVATLHNAGDGTFGLSHDINGKLRVGIPDIGSTEY